MKTAFNLIILLAMAGSVSAGDLEQAASAGFKNMDPQAIERTEVPAPSAAKAEAQNTESWLDKAKRLYAGLGVRGLKDRKLVEGTELSALPENVLKTSASYRKKCEDMNIGSAINISVYRFTLDGKSGLLVQCRFDEYVFAALFDAEGKLLADGSADSSEFGWNSAPRQRQVKFTAVKAAPRSATRGCSVTEQSGTIDSWACRDSEGKIRCYADVNVNGNSFRVNGGCASSYSDCWANGSSAVTDPCGSIEDNGGGTPPSGGGCTVTDQSGTIDSWACRDSAGKIRCYADANINGSQMRIYGNCVDSYSECWSTGSSPVNPCD